MAADLNPPSPTQLATPTDLGEADVLVGGGERTKEMEYDAL